MPTIFFQIWGGGFYLLNKIFFSRAERCTGDKQKAWKANAWFVYLLGLPAILVLFYLKRNWIGFAIEGGSAASMVLGLVIAKRGIENAPKWLDYIALCCVIIGIGFSLYDFGGITTLNQVLELGMSVGFLLGVYLLAKENPNGYLWFMLMNVSTFFLMYIQDYYIMTVQQAISLGFVVDAYRTQLIRKRNSTA